MLHWLHAIHDREDGIKNLIALNGKDGYIGDIGVYIDYLEDGSFILEDIHIKLHGGQ